MEAYREELGLITCSPRWWRDGGEMGRVDKFEGWRTAAADADAEAWGFFWQGRNDVYVWVRFVVQKSWNGMELVHESFKLEVGNLSYGAEENIG